MSPLNVAILFCVGIFLAGGDFAMKTWSSSEQGKSIWYIFAILLYVVGLTAYGYTLKSVDFAAATYAILIFNMLFVAVVGYTYFNDTLSIFELAGIVFGITSIAFFSFSKT
jgi:multidrug transporter EmrE-like cation transporter